MRRAAERFQVSHSTAKRWADRYRLQGWAGMYDRSSRPHHSPRKTPATSRNRCYGRAGSTASDRSGSQRGPTSPRRRSTASSPPTTCRP
nr:leucine zipper domain-containing protein [Streptomyces antibioticus]